jgi:hypothetical protein
VSAGARHRLFVFLGGTLLVASAIAVACSSGDDAAPAPGIEASTTTDARRADDASTDAPAVVDAFTGPFSCQTVDAAALVFCDDFEGVTAPRYGFDNAVVDMDAASMTITDEAGVTHPSSVLEVMLTQAADAGRSAFLVNSLSGSSPSAYSHYEVEIDFRVVGAASLPYVALSVLGFPSGAIKEHGFAVYDGNVFGRLAPKDFAVKDDKSLWHHARIVVARAVDGGATSYATTTNIDGTLVDNIGGVGIGDGGVPSVCVGAFETAPSDKGSVRAQFDNVVIRRW